ncbi:hypothetical protein GDO81_026484 [Engystomops pustulosus]|uniref:Uncharacterized protein n=1 Tax=Engystomops pustulosus TaxID=76066 RepID=A0AAV6YM87_ENGPU|nr:hypothetical protein GDO81_026484 [Engystomops pustulosus]
MLSTSPRCFLCHYCSCSMCVRGKYNSHRLMYSIDDDFSYSLSSAMCSCRARAQRFDLYRSDTLHSQQRRMGPQSTHEVTTRWILNPLLDF